MKAIDKLKKRFDSGMHICVGLDTDINKIPEFLRDKENPILEFNKGIIEATSEYAAAYKINLAFYEKEGAKGFSELEETVKLINRDIPVIGDAKRGDIGNTSKMYAESIYNHFNFDSVTLHPYMGYDSISPFLAFEDKLNFVLALTSNKSADDFEKLKLSNGKFLYEEVIEKVNAWNSAKNCGIVFGATNPNELESAVASFKELIVLLPGVGAQGGSLEEVVETFRGSGNENFLINVSRGIIYADDSPNYSSAAKEIILDYNRKVQVIK